MLDRFILLLIFSLLFWSCSDDDMDQGMPGDLEQTSIIEPDLQKYVDAFFREAEERGLSLDKNNLQVVYTEIEEYCGLGYSNYNNTNVRRVEIDPDCWSDMGSENQKESLMMHELGHAVLARPHLNTVLPNGLAKSMMCGIGPNYSQCAGRDVYSSFAPRLKDYYLDELFNVDIQVPAWAEEKARENGRVIFREDFENNNDWIFVVADTTERIINSYESDVDFDETINSVAANIVSSEMRDDGVFSMWRYSIEPEQIAEGSILDFTATISTLGLVGDGACLVFRVDSGSEASLEQSGFATTQDVIPIKGTNESRYTISIPYCPTEIYRIHFFLLVHSNTRGKVSFDDLELVVYD